MKHVFGVVTVFCVGWLLWYGSCAFYHWDANLSDGWKVRQTTEKLSYRKGYVEHIGEENMYVEQLPNLEQWRGYAMLWFVCSIIMYGIIYVQINVDMSQNDEV